MSWTIHASGVIRERGDDTTRTVTTYDASGTATSTRPYTADENAAADAAAVEARRATLTDTQKLAARLGRLSKYKTDAEIVAALARTNSTAPTTADLNRLLKVMLRREERLSATIALLVRLIDPALLADVSDTTDA
jgi:hypothetical protein